MAHDIFWRQARNGIHHGGTEDTEKTFWSLRNPYGFFMPSLSLPAYD
jgi:hypothetical protein